MRFLFSAFPLILGCLSLLGWVTGSQVLRTAFIARDPMAPVTAVNLVLLGTAIAAWPYYKKSQTLVLLGGIAASLVAVATAVSVGMSTRGDTTLRPWLQLSPGTAFTFLLLAPALLLLLWAAPKLAAQQDHLLTVRRAIALGQTGALLAAMIALFVITGYLYHSLSLINSGALTPMPKMTAIALLSLALAVLLIYPDRGLVRFINNDGPSGEMAQFLLPVSILVPIGLGWLRVVGIRAHLFNIEFGLDLSTMLNVALLGGLTLVSARKLYQSDQKARAVEQELLYRATHDSLTGLVNRPVFREQLTRRLRAASRRNGQAFAVFYLDLDGFKQVNDLLGHDAGDRLLVEIADMLRACTRANDTIARFGGDEFVILFEDIESHAAVEHMADRILAAMPRNFGSSAIAVPIGISIGITINRHGDATPDDILRDADTAMYRAKTKGKSRYEIADAA